MPLLGMISLSWTLLHHLGKKLPHLILPPTLIPIIRRYCNKPLLKKILHLVIRKDQQPVGHPVVSDAAERMPVHLPKVNRLPGFCRLLPGLPKISLPIDFKPRRLLL